MTSLPVRREDLDRLTVRILRPGSKARPEVRLIEAEGRQYVVKDYGGPTPLAKRLLGVLLTRRERAALERAAGIPGVVVVVGTIGRTALVTEYVDATEATSAPPELLTPEFFAQLAATIEALHRRGVVHGDLKKLENVLVSREGRPVLVDFTAAFISGSSPLAALVLPWVADDDVRAVYKLKQRLAPHLLSPQEAAFLEERGVLERVFRWARRYVRYIIKLCASPEQERATVRLK